MIADVNDIDKNAPNDAHLVPLTLAKVPTCFFNQLWILDVIILRFYLWTADKIIFLKWGFFVDKQSVRWRHLS